MRYAYFNKSCYSILSHKNKIVKIIKDKEEKVEIIKELRNKFMEEIDNKQGNFLTKYMRIVLNYIIYLNRK